MNPIISVAEYKEPDRSGNVITITRVTTHKPNKYSKVYMDKKAALDGGANNAC